MCSNQASGVVWIFFASSSYFLQQKSQMWHNNYCFLPDSVFHWQHVGLLYYLVFYISLFIDPLYKLVQSERFFVLTRESVGRLHVGVFSAVWNFLSKVFQFADSFLSQTKGHLLFPFCSQKWQCHCFWRKEICYMVVDFSRFTKWEVKILVFVITDSHFGAAWGIAVTKIVPLWHKLD